MTEGNKYGIKPIKFEVVYDNKYGQIDEYIDYVKKMGGIPTQGGFIDFLTDAHLQRGSIIPLNDIVISVLE